MADVSEKHMEVARKALSAAWVEHEVEYGGGAHIMSCGLMDRFTAAFAAALANAEREGMMRAAEIARQAVMRDADDYWDKHNVAASIAASILSEAGEA